MSDRNITINRPLVGVLTLCCFAAALVIWINQPAERFWLGAFVRVGLLMSAFWLALPSGGREAAWANVSPTTFVALIVAMVLVTRFPKVVIPSLIALAVVSLLLKPRRKFRP